MNQKEFSEWMKYHQAAFTGVGTWLARLDESPDEYAPSRKDVLAAWFKALGYTSLIDAKSATDDMHAGTEEAPPYFDRHPMCVAAIARKRRSSRSTGTRHQIDGRETYHCKICLDNGWVTCWHPVSLQAVTKADESGPWRTCAIRCSCQSGEHRKAASGVVYDPAKWLKIDPIPTEDGAIPPYTSEPEQQSLAVRWLGTRSQHMANYEPAFSQPREGDEF